MELVDKLSSLPPSMIASLPSLGGYIIKKKREAHNARGPDGRAGQCLTLTTYPLLTYVLLNRGGGVKIPPKLSQLVDKIATKFQWLHPCFLGPAFQWD